MKRVYLLIAICCLAVNSLGLLSFAAGPPISSMTLGNKHNLSSRNTAVQFRAKESGDPRSNQICVFCHTPHNAAPKSVLWNRRDPTRTFGHYSSAQLVIDDPDMRAKTQYGEPNGSARLCLSCHDGETALGAVLNGPEIAFPVGYTRVAMLNYSGHHPVSFVYDPDVILALSQRRPLEQFKLPPVDSKVKLDKQQRMQCTSCHDPHQDWSDGTEVDQDGKSLVPFWVDSKHDDVCLVCHNLVQNP
jgi:cytochrome c553